MSCMVAAVTGWATCVSSRKAGLVQNVVGVRTTHVGTGRAGAGCVHGNGLPGFDESREGRLWRPREGAFWADWLYPSYFAAVPVAGKRRLSFLVLSQSDRQQESSASVGCQAVYGGLSGVGAHVGADGAECMVGRGATR
jgi:hypothetical protein